MNVVLQLNLQRKTNSECYFKVNCEKQSLRWKLNPELIQKNNCKAGVEFAVGKKMEAIYTIKQKELIRGFEVEVLFSNRNEGVELIKWGKWGLH